MLQLDDATDRFIVWSMEPQARQLTFSKTGPRFVELSLVAHARGSFQSYQNERRVRFRLQRVLSIDAGGEVWVDEPGLYAVDAIIEGEDPRPSAYVDIK